ncbi:hypothetical protein U1Q18_024907 [Sarracenia purpurea var. burkii]
MRSSGSNQTTNLESNQIDGAQSEPDQMADHGGDSEQGMSGRCRDEIGARASRKEICEDGEELGFRRGEIQVLGFRREESDDNSAGEVGGTRVFAFLNLRLLVSCIAIITFTPTNNITTITCSNVHK